MNANPIDRYPAGIAPKRHAGFPRRAGAIRFVAPRRFGERRRREEVGEPTPTLAPLSIEEAIAEFVAANPAQLYRGGA